MKILRLKCFSKYPEIEPFDIPDEWDGLYDDVEVDISNCEELFNRELPLLVSDMNKKRAKKMKKEMESSPIFLFFDGPTVKNEETHALAQFSNDEVQVWSKSISTFDRLVYDVNKPILDKINRKVKFPVTLRNLFGHRYKGKMYSEIIKVLWKRRKEY